MDATAQKQLEDAAIAAGYTPAGLTDDGTALLLYGVQEPWNPRDENPHSDCMGDALRLAGKLLLDINFGPKVVQVSISAGYVAELFESDQQAATRRSITRAAAALAKGEGKV